MKLCEIAQTKGKSILDVPKLVIHAGKHVGGAFDCDDNQLTSLEGAPSSVGDDFSCASNQLTSLEGAPSSVGGSFLCHGNRLTSLEGAPSSVGGDFYCDHNKLTSLKGAPSSVGGCFDCRDNKLTSLKGAPSSVGDDFYCDNNKLTSLEDVYLHIKQINGEFQAPGNPIKSHVLGLLLIKGITRIELDNEKVADILNSHLPSRGMRSVLGAQAQLQAEGLDKFAQM